MEDLIISKSLLTHQYETMKVEDLAAHYGIGLNRLYQIIDKAGIERKIKTRARQRERKNPIIVD